MREHMCRSRGFEIYGKLFVPERSGNERFPLVIWSHEMGATHETGMDYGHYLAARGVVLYTFDYPGGAPENRSGGDMRQMSIFTEMEDLRSVRDQLSELPFIDGDRIFLMGGSLGGAVSAAAAARNPEDYAGLVLLYPAFVTRDEVRNTYARLEDVPDPFNYMGWFMLGKCYAEAVWDFDFDKEIGKFDKPVLWMHGDTDGNMDMRYSTDHIGAYREGQVDFHVIKDGRHGFWYEAMEDAAELVLEYVKKTV